MASYGKFIGWLSQALALTTTPPNLDGWQLWFDWQHARPSNFYSFSGGSVQLWMTRNIMKQTVRHCSLLGRKLNQLVFFVYEVVNIHSLLFFFYSSSLKYRRMACSRNILCGTWWIRLLDLCVYLRLGPPTAVIFFLRSFPPPHSLSLFSASDI